METPASCMDIDALDDAIYKLCDLRNSTAFQIANANWAELASIDENKYTFNSIVEMDAKPIIRALGTACPLSSPIGHLESVMKELRPKLDQALRSCTYSLEKSRLKIAKTRDTLVRTNGLASLPDNILLRIFICASDEACDWFEALRFYHLSLMCRRLRAIMLKLAETWTSINLGMTIDSAHVILGMMKFAPNAYVRLGYPMISYEWSYERDASQDVLKQRVLDLISYNPFWSRITSLAVYPRTWLADCALLPIEDLEKFLPKELPELTSMYVGGEFSEEEGLFVDRLFRHDIDYPKLSKLTLKLSDWMLNNLPRNITSLTLELFNLDIEMATKLPYTLTKAQHLKELDMTLYVSANGHCALDDVSTTVELPSLSQLQLDITRQGCVDGIARFMRLFRLPQLVDLAINYKTDCQKDEHTVMQEGNDIKPVTELGGRRCLHIDVLGRNGPMSHLETFHLEIIINTGTPPKFYYPQYRLPQKRARAGRPSGSSAILKLLPVWVDIPFRDLPNVKEVELKFDDRSVDVHFPRALEIPAVKQLYLEGIRGLQWKWLSSYLRRWGKSREWKDFEKLRIVACENIDKHVDSLRSLVSDKQFTYKKSDTADNPYDFLIE